MDTKVKKKWVQELRSGKYKQTRGRLCRTKPKQNRDSAEEPKEGSYCCLGVLCKLYAREKHKQMFHYSKKHGWRFNNEYREMPPDEVLEFAKLSSVDACDLAGKNDCGMTFKEIADYIEDSMF